METHLVRCWRHAPARFRSTYRGRAVRGCRRRVHRRDGALGARHAAGCTTDLRDPAQRPSCWRGGGHDRGRARALGMVVFRRPLGRSWPSDVSHSRRRVGRRSGVPVDGFELERDDVTSTVLRSDRFRADRVSGVPCPDRARPSGLTATWVAQPEPRRARRGPRERSIGNVRA